MNPESNAISPKVLDLLERVRRWAEEQPHVTAVALAGSHAHGTARPDSDIDLIILSPHPEELQDKKWLALFGDFKEIATGDYGALIAYCVLSAQYGEIEAGVASTSWAAIPVDPGTHRVVADGILAVYDPNSILERLIECVHGERIPAGRGTAFGNGALEEQL